MTGLSGFWADWNHRANSFRGMLGEMPRTPAAGTPMYPRRGLRTMLRSPRFCTTPFSRRAIDSELTVLPTATSTSDGADARAPGCRSAAMTTTGTHGGMAMAPARYSVSKFSRHLSLTARGDLLISRTLTTATVFMLAGTRASRSASSSARADGRTTRRARSGANGRGIMVYLTAVGVAEFARIQPLGETGPEFARLQLRPLMM